MSPAPAGPGPAPETPTTTPRAPYKPYIPPEDPSDNKALLSLAITEGIKKALEKEDDGDVLGFSSSDEREREKDNKDRGSFLDIKNAKEYPVIMHNTFFPGDTRNFASCDKREIFTRGEVNHGQMTTQVGVDIVDNPNAGLLQTRGCQTPTECEEKKELPDPSTLIRVYKALLVAHEDKNKLRSSLEDSLKKVFGFKPEIRKIGITLTSMPQWNVAACAIHMKYLIKRFADEYTVNRVPYALYNECTIFTVKETFSHDMVVLPEDQYSKKCQESTVKFARRWNFEDGKMKFKEWCEDVCKIKYGPGAIQCDESIIPVDE